MTTKSQKLSIISIDPYSCTGCGICMQSCMNDVIRMKSGKAVIAYQEDCSACFICQLDCAREAITIGWTESK